MDNRYRITVTDLETGQVATAKGIASRIDTSLGLIVALGGHSDAGDAFVTGIVSDSNRKVSGKELVHLMEAVFHVFSNLIRQSKDPGAYFAMSVKAFTRYVEQEVKDPLLRYVLYSGLAQDALRGAEAAGQ